MRGGNVGTEKGPHVETQRRKKGMEKVVVEEQNNRKNWLRLGDFQYFGGDGGEGGSGEGGADGGGDGGEDKPLTAAEVEKLIQAAQDKVRTEYSSKNKELQKQLDIEKQSKMTEQEKHELAMSELEKERANLAAEKNKIFAVGALSDEKVNLPTSFLQFVTSDSEEGTNEKIKVLKTEFDKAVAAEVEKKFGDTSRKLPKGSSPGNSLPTNFAELAEKNNIRKQ